MSNKVVLLLLVGMLGCGTSASTPGTRDEAKKSEPAPPASAEVDLAVLDGVEPLRVMFNSDADKLRVIALLEPA